MRGQPDREPGFGLQTLDRIQEYITRELSMEYKAYELGIKQVGEGKVMATLAKLGVRDRDGDVLRKGLVGGHQLVAIKPQHKWDHVNLGVADVYEKGDTMEARHGVQPGDFLGQRLVGGDPVFP